MCGGSIRIQYRYFRVYLESPSPGDAQEIARIANDYEIAYNVASVGAFPYPYSIEDARAFIASANAAALDGAGYHFGIRMSDSGALVGAAGVLAIDRGSGSCGVGYWLGKEHWGKGYAKEAVTLLAGFSFRVLGVSTVNADVFGFNARSVSLLGSVGFVKDASFRNMKPHYNGYSEELRYSMAKDSFGNMHGDIMRNMAIS